MITNKRPQTSSITIYFPQLGRKKKKMRERNMSIVNKNTDAEIKCKYI